MAKGKAKDTSFHCAGCNKSRPSDKLAETKGGLSLCTECRGGGARLKIHWKDYKTYETVVVKEG